MGGVLSLVIRTDAESNPIAVISLCNMGDVGAKVIQQLPFSTLLTKFLFSLITLLRLITTTKLQTNRTSFAATPFYIAPFSLFATGNGLSFHRWRIGNWRF